ncbi:MAG TPA: hypothetical protein VH143_32475, partial [Kofleriaceae bacterium]|nr:hypothetical protein [Kofleriaceae bacterium]
RYTLRALASQHAPATQAAPVAQPQNVERLAGNLTRKPAAAAGASTRPAGRDSAEGGGYAG